MITDPDSVFIYTVSLHPPRISVDVLSTPSCISALKSPDGRIVAMQLPKSVNPFLRLIALKVHIHLKAKLSIICALVAAVIL